jgi:hypothetical protein
MSRVITIGDQFRTTLRVSEIVAWQVVARAYVGGKLLDVVTHVFLRHGAPSSFPVDGDHDRELTAALAQDDAP